jgi:osmoprotectant transport system ATP-binding protein
VYPSELSGGQQQRIGLARALVADPAVLLMDEPFGALDNVTRSKIHAEFKVLDELKRKTIIMVTHDVQEAFELGDHICLMDKGKILQDGRPSNLLFNPANAFVQDFLQEQRLTRIYGPASNSLNSLRQKP